MFLCVWCFCVVAFCGVSAFYACFCLSVLRVSVFFIGVWCFFVCLCVSAFSVFLFVCVACFRVYLISFFFACFCVSVCVCVCVWCVSAW